MATKDFLPNGWSAFAEWMANFTTQFATLVSKYELTNEQAQLVSDNAWLQYWVQAKFNAKQQEKQLSDYMDAVANGESNEAQPNDPVWDLPSNPPATAQPGLKKRLRSLARRIKANPVYTQSDGELLGIIGTEEGELSPETAAPDIRLRSLANFAVEVEFRKQGTDALRVEIRHKNGNWILAAILTSSPGVFNVVPADAGDAEQIEVRAVFLVRNQPFGNYSPNHTVTIQP